MSKSLNNTIGITENPNDMFGKVMSITDTHMLRFYELLSDISAKEQALLKQNLLDGSLHPMTAKKDLAQTIVSRFHNSESGKKARAHFENVFSNMFRRNNTYF